MFLAFRNVDSTQLCGFMPDAIPVLYQGEPWTSVFVGHDINPVTQQEETQRLMLERFQEEVRNLPGYDGT